MKTKTLHVTAVETHPDGTFVLTLQDGERVEFHRDANYSRATRHVAPRETSTHRISSSEVLDVNGSIVF